MAVQKPSFPSFTSIVSILSILLYFAGFLRVELELKEQKNRIRHLENIAETNPPSNDGSLEKPIKNVPELKYKSSGHHKYRRQASLPKNMTKAENTADTSLKINKLLSEGRLQLCQSKCSSGPPGPPGPRGEKGARGRKGQKGRTGNKGDRGLMGSPGKSGKQGIVGPMGPQGQVGAKGQKGDIGPAGMPGAKGEPGESISAPAVAVSPARLTVNESGSASFQCSVSGNPTPTIAWSKLGNRSEINQSAISRGTLNLKNVKDSDSGMYQCSAANVLGKTQAKVQLVVNVRPAVFLHPGPLYVIEGSNFTFPTCHVTGHPKPVVTWSRSFGPLPQGRVQSNNSVVKLSDVRKSDSDNYLCTATNLLGSVVKRTVLVVVSLPRFTIKPPAKVVARPGGTLTLNCSAAGDPQPVISWKKQGGQLPDGRSQQINGALVIRSVAMNDTGLYICVATSAGVFDVETVTYIKVKDPPRDCSDLLKSGHTQSGVYSVNPDGKGYFAVYCDMRTDGGGWTVFQRRQDGSVDFYRGWNDYKSGFGQLTAEFWLGNDKIHRLTVSRPSSLRVELEDWTGVRVFARYGRFNIGDEQTQYRLEVDSYSGTAGDSLTGGHNHNNMAFSTKDRDNDRYSRNCAVENTGAWWYNICQNSNLNGQYLGEKYGGNGLRWYGYKKNSLSFKFTEMKLRPSS